MVLVLVVVVSMIMGLFVVLVMNVVNALFVLSLSAQLFLLRLTILLVQIIVSWHVSPSHLGRIRQEFFLLYHRHTMRGIPKSYGWNMIHMPPIS